MTEFQHSNIYDLEERTLSFARDCRSFVSMLPKTIANNEDSHQLVRSSGSVGANYIEGNESISQKDFVHRIKICRKEAKESRYWLLLIDTNTTQKLESQRTKLVQESTELMKIFGAILKKSV